MVRRSDLAIFPCIVRVDRLDIPFSTVPVPQVIYTEFFFYLVPRGFPYRCGSFISPGRPQKTGLFAQVLWTPGAKTPFPPGTTISSHIPSRIFLIGVFFFVLSQLQTLFSAPPSGQIYQAFSGLSHPQLGGTEPPTFRRTPLLFVSHPLSNGSVFPLFCVMLPLLSIVSFHVSAFFKVPAFFLPARVDYWSFVVLFYFCPFCLLALFYPFLHIVPITQVLFPLFPHSPPTRRS